MDIVALRRLERMTFLVIDLISFSIVFIVVQWLRYSQIEILVGDIPYIGLILTVILIVNYIFGLYSLEEDGRLFDSVQSSLLVVVATIISFFVVILCVYLLGVERFVGQYFGRGVLLGLMGGFALLASGCRFFIRRSFIKINNRRCYLVLANEEQFSGMVEENKKSLIKKRLEFCSTERFENIYQRDRGDFKNYTGIVVSHSVLENHVFANKLMELRFQGFPILTIHDFFENVWLKVPLFDLKDRWFAAERGFGLLHRPVNQKIKRISDIILAIFLAVPTLCLFPLIAALLKLTDRGPVLFSQKRVGESGKIFTLYKFRSMNHEVTSGQIRQITPIGKLLRRVRLDELPQFWNVFRGDMSFIGPRPETVEFTQAFEKKNSYYKLRHLVKPGITGWAQVLYPYATFEDAMEKLQYELYYIKNYSVLLDMSIMVKTIRVVLFGRGK